MNPCPKRTLVVKNNLKDSFWRSGIIFSIISQLLFISIVYPQNHALFISNTATSCANYVDIGDLDISGDQMTIEALIVKQADAPSCQNSFPGMDAYDIISKHTGPQNVNYLLRPSHSEITTDSGFFHTRTEQSWITQNSCNHIAMVYDGVSLRHYINGCLFDSVPARGDLVRNDFTAKIAWVGGLPIPGNEQFYGYIDEMRIWNVARTEAQIDSFKQGPLPNPASVSGLVAYYDFESGYVNAQGNAQWDGMAHGNAAIADTSLEIPGDPSVSVGGNVSICKGSIATLTASGAAVYKWGTNPVTSSSVYYAVPSETKTYTVIGSFAYCHSDTDTITVHVYALPTLQVTSSATICRGDSILLVGSGATHYQWAPDVGLSNSTASGLYAFPSLSTTYTLAGNDGRCRAVPKMVEIQVGTPPFIVLKDTINLCQGNSVVLRCSGGEDYAWSPSAGLSNTGISSPVASPGIHTMYTVTVTLGPCRRTDSVNILIAPLPSLSLNPSETICRGDSIRLSVAGAETYKWEPASFLDISDTSHPLAGPDTSMWFLVRGKATNSCINYDSVFIAVSKLQVGLPSIPNVFTPNNDGQNDLFSLNETGTYVSYELNIYDRWGMRVFASASSSDSWDGMKNGKPLPSGDYYYLFRAVACGQDRLEKAGYIQLQVE